MLDSYSCRTNFRIRMEMIQTERNIWKEGREGFQSRRKDKRIFSCCLFSNFHFWLHLPIACVFGIKKQKKTQKGKNSRRTSKGWAHDFSCLWFIVMHTFTILKNPRDASSSTKHKITLPHPQKCFVWRTMCPTIHHRSWFCPLTLQRGSKFSTGGAFSLHRSIHPQQISLYFTKGANLCCELQSTQEYQTLQSSEKDIAVYLSV